MSNRGMGFDLERIRPKPMERYMKRVQNQN
jgi:hypothetical protein